MSITVSGANAACVGDCDGDGEVRVHELITVLGIALGNRSVGSCGDTTCPNIDFDISCMNEAVRNALFGCPIEPTPTRTPRPTPVPWTYHLIEGSSVVVSTGDGTRPVPLALTGTMRMRNSEVTRPNTFFSLDVIDVAFETEAGWSITAGGDFSHGCLGGSGYGCVIALTITRTTDAVLSLSFDGAVAVVRGQRRRFEAPVGPSRFMDLALCDVDLGVGCDQIFAGSMPGYALTLSAERE